MSERTTIIVGAGPAGLAAAAVLRSRHRRFRLLERGARIAQNWANAYDSLRLHTGKHLSHLPGLRFGLASPLFPSRDDFLDYLDRYVTHHALEPETGVDVRRIARAASGWHLELATGEAMAADTLIVATGIMSNPVFPDIAGRERFAGEVLHSVAYRHPAPHAGRRVLVVGVGNSGAEIASELALAGADVTIAVRSGANVVPLTLFGLPIQYASVLVRTLPRRAQDAVVAAVRLLSEAKRGPSPLPRPAHSPLDAIPLIGYHLVDAIRAGRVRVRGAVCAFTETGMRFDDGAEEPFDAVILATGFRAALQPFDGTVRTDARGFALRRDRIASADWPDLFFIGHNYDSTGGLANIRRDAQFLP